MHVRARKDKGEGVLREGILGSSSQFVRAVGEKLFFEKLFSELGSLRETVLKKPFSERPFYELQPTNCSVRSCSTSSGSVGGRSERSGSAKAVAFQRTFSDCASAQPRRRYSYFLTRIENQDHADGLPD